MGQIVRRLVWTTHRGDPFTRPTGRPTHCGRRGYPVASGRQQFSIISDGLPTQLPDIDPDETREWVESFDSVVRTRGRARARYVMLRLLERAREQQVGVPGPAPPCPRPHAPTPP